MSDFVLAWETLFGTYQPIVLTDPVTSEAIQCIDFGYCSRVLFFIVVVYCILKLLGGVLRDSKS